MSFTIGYNSPNSVTQNLDVVMSLAYANCGDQVYDAISKNNAVFYEIKKGGFYQGVDQLEPYMEVPLMYGLGNAEWYEGWDTLGTQPTEGITAATYPWRQLACPTGYNRREQRVTNPARIAELVATKVEQTQLTMVDTWARAFLQGNVGAAGGNIYTPVVQNTTGRSGIEPLAKLVYYDTSISGIGQPSGALTVGGLDQATYPWWRNWSYDLGGITTYAGLLAAFDLMFERTNRGAGGAIDLIICDDTTRSLLNSAYYQVYRRSMDSDNNYPFDNLKFRNARVVCDELIPDVEGGLANTDTKGTAYFLNSKFLKVKYDKQCNFVLGEMQKPTNQDGKVGHCMWMGNLVMLNRKKHGVCGNIPRTLTVS